MDSPLNQIVDDLVARKLSFIPILPGEKRPGAYIKGVWTGLNNWTEYAHRLPNEQEIELWRTWPAAGVGLITGSLSGVIALDFDNNFDLIKHLLGDLVFDCCKKGAKGFTAFFKYCGESNKKWSYGGETILELLADGRQTVLPPSVHPSGNEYIWVGHSSLIQIPASQLQELPKDFIARMDNFFSGLNRPKSTSLVTQDTIEMEEVGRALQTIPADDYALWIKIGMILRSSFGGHGLEIWDNWSKKSKKYAGWDEIKKKWASFAGVKDLTISTLFYEANLHGFGETVIDTPKPQKVEVKKTYFNRDLISQCPGLVGRIAFWINENSIYPQPELAFAAALTAVGALKGHRVRGETNLRTNILTIGIAPSGAGKSRAMDLIEALFNAAGVDSIFGGRPKSDSGLIKMLQEGKGRKIINWDEIGLALSEMTSTRAQVHKSGILSRVMDLFSKSGGNYRGDQYANHDGKQARIDIDQPCLCIYGASTPLRFFEALSSSHAVDGFAARWLVFESQDPFPKRREIGPLTIPAELIKQVQDLERMTTNVSERGNIAKILEIEPATIKFSDDAKVKFLEAWDQFDANRAAATTEAGQAIWGRAAEHLQKVCLVLERGYQDISVETVEFAREVVQNSLEYTIAAVDSRVSDNEVHKNLNKVLEIIRKAGKEISRWELIQRTRWLSSRDRNDIIVNLSESNSIEIRKEITSRKTAFYFSAL